jgi:hypothetical protein
MCEKKSYPSEIAALCALHAVRHRRRGDGRVENGAYFCASCHAFHLTSHASGKRRLESSTGVAVTTYPENGSSI